MVKGVVQESAEGTPQGVSSPPLLAACPYQSVLSVVVVVIVIEEVRSGFSFR
jgi:hypothetical protein